MIIDEPANTPLTGGVNPIWVRPPRREAFLFMGTGGEYFRIWIVNLLLSVVTLGIYSAWAKVRRLQYFYRHTRVAGASFDYHGNPIAILKGRIIGACLFGGYYAAGAISPVAGAVAFAALAGIFPFLISRSLRFRLHNSSYRGLRFAFSGSVREAYWVFLGLPILVVLSFFTLTPFWYHRFKRYQHAHAAYGRTCFSYDAPVTGFYRIYVTVSLVVLGVVAVLAVIVAMIAAAIGNTNPGDGAARTLPLLAVILSSALYLFGILGAWSYTTGRVRNLIWDNTQLGSHRFESAVEPGHLFLLVLTNMIAVACTLGFFLPFAQVRLTRYFAESMTLLSAGSLDEFVAGEAPAVSAIGEEALDIFDIDLAF